MPFKIDTQMKGVYVISEDSITHYFFQKEETSPGLLVTKHYQEVEKALYLAWFLREGKCYESIAAYYHTDDDLKNAPHLEKVINALEKQVNLFTEGEYQKYTALRENWKALKEIGYWH